LRCTADNGHSRGKGSKKCRASHILHLTDINLYFPENLLASDEPQTAVYRGNLTQQHSECSLLVQSRSLWHSDNGLLEQPRYSTVLWRTPIFEWSKDTGPRQTRNYESCTTSPQSDVDFWFSTTLFMECSEKQVW